MGNDPSRFIGDAHRPVDNVSWEEVQEFIRRLNIREGRTSYRLPTELDEYAWCNGTTQNSTHRVGQLKPNGWGLYDMHGNVWEWVLDWYGQYPVEPVRDPLGPVGGKSRVIRGGGWDSPAIYCR